MVAVRPVWVSLVMGTRRHCAARLGLPDSRGQLDRRDLLVRKVRRGHRARLGSTSKATGPAQGRMPPVTSLRLVASPTLRSKIQAASRPALPGSYSPVPQGHVVRSGRRAHPVSRLLPFSRQQQVRLGLLARMALPALPGLRERLARLGLKALRESKERLGQ